MERKQFDTFKKAYEEVEKIKEVYRQHGNDHEVSHCEIDKLLLSYVRSKEVTDLFYMSPKWYA